MRVNFDFESSNVCMPNPLFCQIWIKSLLQNPLLDHTGLHDINQQIAFLKKKNKKNQTNNKQLIVMTNFIV